MPKNWFFEIYEDTPEEEAANLMEHSTLTLDLSSDDEGEKKCRDDRGKENTPPEGYDAPAASSSATVAAPRQTKKTDIIRKKTAVNDMDDGSRSPLSDLETESFIPEGLTKDAHVIVDEVAEAEEKSVLPFDVKNLFTKPVASGEKSEDTDLSAGGSKGEIVVWEDEASKEQAAAEDVVS